MPSPEPVWEERRAWFYASRSGSGRGTLREVSAGRRSGPRLGVCANFPLPRVHRPGNSAGAPGRAVPGAGPPPLPQLRARRRMRSVQSRLETRARGAGEGPPTGGVEGRSGEALSSADPASPAAAAASPLRSPRSGTGGRRRSPAFPGARSAPGPRYLYIQSGRRSPLPLLGASARPAPPPLRMPDGVVAPGPGPPGAASLPVVIREAGRSLGRGAGPRARSPSRALPGRPAPELLAGRRHRAELGRRGSPHAPRPFPARARTRRAPRRPSPPRPRGRQRAAAETLLAAPRACTGAAAPPRRRPVTSAPPRRS